MRVRTAVGTRRQRMARAIRDVMIVADAKTQEEFERRKRTVTEDDVEFSNTLADALIEIADALLEPLSVDLEKLDKPEITVKLNGEQIAKAVARHGA